MSQTHALCCITDALVDLLSGHPGLTVSLNRDDCWEDEELHKHGQCAVNIMVQNSIAGIRPKNRTISTKEVICTYDNVLPLDIEIYAIQCEGSFCKAAGASGVVLSKLLADDHGLPVVRLNYRGESYRTITRGDINFTHIVVQVEVEYVFSPQRPWLTFKGI